jgi:hypothetical protein
MAHRWNDHGTEVLGKGKKYYHRRDTEDAEIIEK